VGTSLAESAISQHQKTAGRERGSGWDGDKRRWWRCRRRRRRRQYGMIGENVRDWTSGGKRKLQVGRKQMAKGTQFFPFLFKK
jgi:hypothetical protein